jgi:Tfp pilus assembly protein PilF
MNEAIAANPDYADAHYNLAVIYATAEPPSKEQAKVHYAKATSLGAEADPSLEKLLR